ncbi:MAG: DUF86 domain-containing protein [archaeon]
MLDKQRIATLVSDINKYVGQLAQLNIKTKADLADFKNYHAASMICFTIINKSIDLGNEIVISQNFGFTQTYSDIFIKLHEHKIIDSNLKSKLIRLILNRNKIAHEYADLDEGEIFEIISETKSVEKMITALQEYASLIEKENKNKEEKS